MLLHEDPKVFVFNKPAGLAVQGGSGVTRHVDDMLEAWRSKKGEKPRLVHRLDRDTSGVLVVARTRHAAMKLAEAFRARETKKTYWALVKGLPKKREDKISTWLVKEQTPDGDRMRVAKHGEEGADHAVSYYRVVEQAGQTMSWLEMEPYTGRTHQLARACRAYRQSDHRRPEILRGRYQLGFSRRHAEPPAFARSAHRHPASRQGLHRCDRADAAAYAPELEPARLRRGERGGGMSSVPLLDRRDTVDVAAVSIMIFLTFAWGLNGVATKVSNLGFDPVFVSVARSAIGGLLCLPVVRGPADTAVSTATERCKAGLLVGFLFGAEFLCIFIAFDYTSVGRGSLMINTMPFWVLIGAHFLLGERMTVAKLVGILLAFAGVFVIFADRLSAPGPSAWIGDLLTLLAGILWAATTLAIKRSRLATASAEKLLLYQLAVSAIMTAPLLMLSGPILREVSPLTVSSLLFQSIFVVAFTYLIWFWLMRRYPASGLASFAFLTPAFSVLLGGVLLGEPLTWKIGLALVLIAGGLIIVNRPTKSPG